MDFVAAVTGEGYYGDKDRLIKTGHVVCELLDGGANWRTIEAEIVIHHGAGARMRAITLPGSSSTPSTTTAPATATSSESSDARPQPGRSSRGHAALAGGVALAAPAQADDDMHLTSVSSPER